MTKSMFALAGAAVVATGFAAAPADARPHYRTAVVCTKWRHGRCVSSHRVRRGRYVVGYVLGPRYGYTAYSALPRTYVTRYGLTPRYRYVYTNGTVYVVDPTTYAITRILRAIR